MAASTGLRSGLRPVAVAIGAARLAVAVPVAYLMALTAAAWYATARKAISRSTTVDPPASRRYALLVPAHDEEHVIGATVESMGRLDWPVDRIAVHVVADHCTDRTVELATKAGAIVHEHDRSARGKGPALEWALSRLLEQVPPYGGAPDVVVIVDADTIVERDLVRALDRAFTAGADVVQGQYRVHEPGTSTVTGMRAAALALRHHLRPLGRTTIGGSCGLFGNGMAFRAEVLRGRQWSNHLTEDIELQMELLLDGTLVAYTPDAVVEAEMPATFEGARTQNERWERGRLDLARRYVPRLVRLAIADRRRRIPAVDAALDHVVPPLSVLVAATGGVAAAGTAVGLLRRRGVVPSGWAIVGALAVHVLSGLLLARAPWSVYRSLASAPRMVWWKLGLWRRMVVRPGAEGWARTQRAGTPGGEPVG